MKKEAFVVFSVLTTVFFMLFFILGTVIYSIEFGRDHFFRIWPFVSIIAISVLFGVVGTLDHYKMLRPNWTIRVHWMDNSITTEKRWTYKSAKKLANKYDYNRNVYEYRISNDRTKEIRDFVRK